MNVIVGSRQGGKSFSILSAAIVASILRPVIVVCPTHDMADRLHDELIKMIIKAGNGYVSKGFEVLVHGNKIITFTGWANFVASGHSDSDAEVLIDDADMILNRYAPRPISTISVTGRKV